MSSTAPTSSSPGAPPEIPPAVQPVIPVAAMVAIMWVVELIDTVADHRLDRFGIRPRQLIGLEGIVFAPFLHSGFAHLIGNTVPFLLLGGVIALGSATGFVEVTVVVAVISGGGTWLIAPEHTVHIGASGLVFGYLAYLISRGFFDRKISYLLIGVVALVMYGSVLWGVLPTQRGVSWQGHLFGAVGGVLAAAMLHGKLAADESTTPSPP